MLASATIVVVAVVANLLLPHRMRLIGVALLTVPQFYLPVHVELATLAIIWTLTTCLAGLAARGRLPANSPLVIIAFAFAGTTSASLLWALPGALNSGMATVARSILFALWLREVIVIARGEPRFLDTIMLWMTPGVVVESALTVLFRLRPTLESQFLRSVFAPFFVGPQADNLYADWRNNVVYGFKAGGLFVNGNIASMFCGVAALLLVVTARRTGCRPLYYFASVAIAGSIFTGSKTAVFVAAGMAFVIILLPRNLRAGSAIATIPLVLSLPLIFSIVSDALSRIAPNLYAASERSYSGRQSMWRGGAELFQDSPFFGLGFGGWGERIGRYTGEWHLPPHNYVVAAWANSGMFTALLAIAFVVAVSVISLRVAAAQSTVQSRRTAVIAFCAVAWVLVHGLADNTTMYGEQRSMILMGLAVGYIYAMKENQREVVPGSAHDGPRFLSFPA